MNRRHLLLFGGLALSAGIAVFGDRAPDAPATVEAAPHTASAPVQRTSDRKHAAPAILALVPRQDLIGHAPPSEPPALFGTRALFENPAESPAEAAPVPATPPLPFTYLGKKYESGKWEIFLAIGEKTYFVREGSVIDNTYVVNAIKPPTMTLTFLPQKEMQTLSIGADQ